MSSVVDEQEGPPVCGLNLTAFVGGITRWA